LLHRKREEGQDTVNWLTVIPTKQQGEERREREEAAN